MTDIKCKQVVLFFSRFLLDTFISYGEILSNILSVFTITFTQTSDFVFE